MDRNRVVVTGLGLVTPLGVGVETNWKHLCAGRSGIQRISTFEVSDLCCQIGGLVQGFEPEVFVDSKELRRTDSFIQFALAASSLALRDSGLGIDAGNAHRVGVVIGSGMGGLQSIERGEEALRLRGADRVSPFFVTMAIANLAPGRVAIQTGAKGPNLCFSTACTAGTHSVGHAYRLIRHGYADAVIAGGAEACVTRLALAGFCAMRALSRRNDAPAAASRPFDRDRDGFVIGEGAGILILERLEHALARGARIHAEIIGYGETGDAHHIVAPSPEGEGAAACMRSGLADAGIEPVQVDYINAHGTSTPYNDLAETQAIRKVFGPHAYRLAVSSTKSMTGHLLGAAGAVEAIYTILALSEGILPPTINQETPDPECDLDYVPNQARRRVARIALSNSFGFGGTNGTLVLSRYDG